MQTCSIEWRWHHCVINSIQKSQLLVIKPVRNHLPLLQDQVRLVRRHCIKLDQEEDECQAIDAEGLPEDGRRTTMQQQVASQLWSHHTEEYDTNHTQAEVPTDAMAPGRHIHRATAIRSILCRITLNIKKTGDSN